MKNNNNEDGYLDEMESIGLTWWNFLPAWKSDEETDGIRCDSISCGGVCSLRYGIIPDMHCNCADSVP